MNQEEVWNNEYKQKQMLSPSTLPQADVVRFVRWLKKQKKKAATPIEVDTFNVLDLGSGTGRNSMYLAQMGATVTGYEIANTALAMAEKQARHAELPIAYKKQDIGKAYQLGTESIDLILDVTSSNSLNEEGRAKYLEEVSRVLKPGGWMFVRALSLEGDAHAKRLVKDFPGAGPDTYVHPDLGVAEKVFSRETFTNTYAPYFRIAELERVSHYPNVAGRRYKREYWIAYLEKVAPEV